MVVSRLFILAVLLVAAVTVAGRDKDGKEGRHALETNSNNPGTEGDAKKGTEKRETVGSQTGQQIDEGVSVSGKVAAETGAIVDDAVDFFWCLFLSECGDTHKGVNEPFESGEELEVMETFCGLSTTQGHFDCSCCADHTLAEPGKLSGLFYGGGPDDKAHMYAPAFERRIDGDEKRKGKVRAWSLGGHVLSVWCDRARPICRCEDPTTFWHEEEPGCRPSNLCVPPDPPVEGVSGWSPLNRTGESSAAGAGVDIQNCLDNENGTERISIGRARCEDMSVNQCDRLYARGYDPGTWHFCKVDQHAVRTCGANIVDKTTAKTTVDAANDWALQRSYTPDTNWKIHQEELSVVRVDVTPLQETKQVRIKLEDVHPWTFADTFGEQHLRREL